MNPQEIARLIEIYRRESRSLLQYVRDASPYTQVSDRLVLDRIRSCAEAQSAMIGVIGDLFHERRIAIPQLPAFSVGFTDLNFVGVRTLLPKLIAEKNRAIGLLKVDLGLGSASEIYRLIESLIHGHKKCLEQFEAMADSGTKGIIAGSGL